MWIKLLGLFCAGVFIGAAVFEIKTDHHGKKKERRENQDDATPSATMSDDQKTDGAAPESA